MSRTQIANLTGTTQQVNATVNFITYINGRQVVKLTRVNIDNIAVNHCWLYSQSFKTNFKFKRSDINKQITFTAKIDTYYKVRQGKKVIDYCLTKVDNIQFI